MRDSEITFGTFHSRVVRGMANCIGRHRGLPAERTLKRGLERPALAAGALTWKREGK